MWKHLILAPLSIVLVYLCVFHGKAPGADIAKRQHKIEQAKPDVVFIGNSMLNKGIDPAVFEEMTGLKGLICHSNGSGSKWWYLCLKNVVCQSKHKPKMVYLTFRDHFLTDPDFRIHGRYAIPIRTVSTEADEKSASCWEWGPTEAKERWDTRIAKTAADWCRVDKFRQFKAMAQVFDDKQMNQLEITQRQLAAEKRENADLFNFYKALEGSYLPQMIQLCQENEIELVLVRIKKRRDADEISEPLELRDYLADLRGFLDGNGVRLIDITQCKEIELAHYGPGDHMNVAGKQVMTEYVANGSI